MHRPGPTVIKLGGSFAFSADLGNWIAAIAGCGGSAVIVPGGGPFADAVRAAQVQMGFDDRTAHRMALLAMEQYGCAIKSLHEALSLAGSLDSIRRGLAGHQVPVWLPTQMALSATDIPPSWDVTSDSLAAWLAGKSIDEVAAAIGVGAPPLGVRGKGNVGGLIEKVLGAFARGHGDFFQGSRSRRICRERHAGQTDGGHRREECRCNAEQNGGGARPNSSRREFSNTHGTVLPQGSSGLSPFRQSYILADFS